MKIKWILLAVIAGMAFAGLVDQASAYNLDNLSANLSSGAVINIPYNLTYDGSFNVSQDELNLTLNGSILAWRTGSNKTLTGITLNNVTDVYTFDANGTSGWLNLSATMRNASSNYTLWVDDVLYLQMNSTTENKITFNYTGAWSTHNFKVNSSITVNPLTPAITSYSPANLTPTIDVNNLATFSAGSNQSVTWVWTGVNEGVGDGTPNSTATQTWGVLGAKTVTATCSNVYGSCGTIQWNVNVIGDGSGNGTNYDWLDGIVTPTGSTITINPSVTGSPTTGGAYTFGYVFVDGQSYWINVTKSGYYPNNTLITFNEDHEVWNPVLSIIPIIPTILNWNNDFSHDTDVTLSVYQGTTILFDILYNGSTSCSWTGASVINCTGTTSHATKQFSTLGSHNVSVSTSNANGTSSTITWQVNVISTLYTVDYEYGCTIPSGLAAVGNPINKLFRTEVLVIVIVLLIIIVRVIPENPVVGLLTVGILVISAGAFLPLITDSIDEVDDAHTPCMDYTDIINITGKENTWISLTYSSIKSGTQNVYNSSYTGINNTDYQMDYTLGKIKPLTTGNFTFSN